MRTCTPCGADLGGRRADARACSPRCRAAARRARVKAAADVLAACVAEHGTAEGLAALDAPGVAEALGRALVAAEEAAGRGGGRQ